MSLEQKNKPELVKLARELQQEVKALKLEKQSLEAIVNKPPTIDGEEVSLPYQVAAAIKVTANKSKLYILNFNLEGQCFAKESPCGLQEHYKIQHKVDQFTANISFRRNHLVKKEVVTETKQETKEGEQTNGN